MANLKDIEYILENKNDILSLLKTSSKGSILTGNPSRQMEVQINQLEGWLGRYRNEKNPIEKKKIVSNINNTYGTIDSRLKDIKFDIKNQIKDLNKTAVLFGDNSLKSDIDNYNKIYDNIYNKKKESNKQPEIVDMVPEDTDKPKEEVPEVKPVVDTPKTNATDYLNNKTTTNTTVDTYKGREVKRDDKGNIMSFKSLKTNDWVDIKDRNKENINKGIQQEKLSGEELIKEGVLGDNKRMFDDNIKNITDIQNKLYKSKSATTDKEKEEQETLAKKGDELIQKSKGIKEDLLSRGFSEKEIKDRFNM